MTSFIIVLARTYPLWATPMAVSFIGAAIVLFRKKHKGVALYCGAIGGVAALGVILYVVFDGYATLVPFLYDLLMPVTPTNLE